MGGVLVAAGKPADAVAVLKDVVNEPRATAGCRVQLALALWANRQPADARAALERALQVPDRSPREQAEWRAATLLLQRDKP